MSCAFATRSATREYIDNTLRNQRPHYKPPGLPQCYASDLQVPRSHKEAMRSDYTHLWEDPMRHEFRGLQDAGTCEPEKQPVDSYINAM